MRVLWFTNVILPEFASRIGLAQINQNGWLSALVEAIRVYAPGIDLTIACEGPCGNDVVIDNVRFVTLGYLHWRYWRTSVDQIDLERIRQFVKEVNPDLIHLHGTEGRWVTLPECVWDARPVVASIQGVINGCAHHYTGDLLPSEIHSFWNLPNMLLTRWSVYRGAKAWEFRLAPQEAQAFRRIRHFLGRTTWDFAWTKYLAPDATYHTVGEILRRPFYDGGRNASTIVSHSIFCGAAAGYPLKGGHWLIKAVAALKDKYPDVQLRIANSQKVAAPKGLKQYLHTGEYHRYLARLIRDLGVEKNIVTLPSLSAQEVAEELKRAEIFCLPSLCENSPNSLGEAMLMGVPCVATDVGGTETILKKDEQGLLVPSGDPAILSHSIDRLFSNPSLAESFARAGRFDAERRYAPERVVQQLLDAYESVLKVVCR